MEIEYFSMFFGSCAKNQLKHISECSLWFPWRFTIIVKLNWKLHSFYFDNFWEKFRNTAKKINQPNFFCCFSGTTRKLTNKYYVTFTQVTFSRAFKNHLKWTVEKTATILSTSSLLCGKGHNAKSEVVNLVWKNTEDPNVGSLKLKNVYLFCKALIS